MFILRFCIFLHSEVTTVFDFYPVRPELVEACPEPVEGETNDNNFFNKNVWIYVISTITSSKFLHLSNRMKLSIKRNTMGFPNLYLRY